MPAPAPLTLHIYRDSALSARHLTLKASDKTTPLYTVSAHSGLSGHANLEIFVPSPAPVAATPSASPAPGTTTKIAEIDFHTFSSRISIHLPLHSTALELRSKGLFSRGYYFESQSGTGAGVLVGEGDEACG